MLGKNLIQAAAGSGGDNYWFATLGIASTNVSGETVAVDGDGNVYVCGGVSSTTFIAKYSQTGVLKWQIGMPVQSSWQRLVLDGSGNIYACFYTRPGGGAEQILTVKFNNSGVLQWQRQVALGDGAISRDIVLDSNGNIYVYGIFGIPPYIYYTLIKYDASGNLQWQRTISGGLYGSTGGISIDSSDNIYVSGYGFNSSLSRYEGMLLKYNTSGTVLWQRGLYSTGTPLFNDTATDSGGNVYAIASYNGNILLVKYNGSGSLLWQRFLTGAINDYGLSVVTDSESNVYICGYTDSTGAGSDDALIASYTSNGGLRWQRVLGGINGEQGRSITVGPNDDIYVAGFTSSAGVGSKDALIIKLPNDGSLVGTYGSISYSSSALADSSASLTSYTSSLFTSSSGSYSITTSSLSTSASGLISSTTYL